MAAWQCQGHGDAIESNIGEMGKGRLATWILWLSAGRFQLPWAEALPEQREVLLGLDAEMSCRTTKPARLL